MVKYFAQKYSFPLSHAADVTHRKFFLSHFPVLLRSAGKTWRLEDVIAKLNEKYGTQLLVNFFVGTDDRDSNSHIIHVGVQLLSDNPCLFFSASTLTTNQFLQM